MDAEKQLIRVVKSHPEVWDKELKLFYTTEENRSSWESIGRQLVPMTSGTVAFMRFKALAVMYVKEYQLEQHSTEFKSTWLYFDDLKFLNTEMNRSERIEFICQKRSVERERMSPGSQQCHWEIGEKGLKQDEKSNEEKNANTIPTIEIFSSEDEEKDFPSCTSLRHSSPVQHTDSKRESLLLKRRILSSDESDDGSVPIPRKQFRRSLVSQFADKGKSPVDYPAHPGPKKSLISQSQIDISQHPSMIMTYCFDKIPEDLQMRYITKFMQFTETFLKTSMKKK